MYFKIVIIYISLVQLTKKVHASSNVMAILYFVVFIFPKQHGLIKYQCVTKKYVAFSQLIIQYTARSCVLLNSSPVLLYEVLIICNIYSFRRS